MPLDKLFLLNGMALYPTAALNFSSYTVVPNKFFTVNSTFCALVDLKLILVSAINGFGYAETDKV